MHRKDARWARRLSAVAVAAGIVGAAAAPAALASSITVGSGIDDRGVPDGYVYGSADDFGHRVRVEVVRGGAVVAAQEDDGSAFIDDVVPQPGDQVAVTDLSTGDRQAATYTGKPALDASVCGTPSSVTVRHDAGASISSAFADLYYGAYDRRNTGQEGKVTSDAGDAATVAFEKPLSPDWMVFVTETLQAGPGLQYSAATYRKVGACPAPPPAPQPTPQPQQDTTPPAGALVTRDKAFRPSAAYAALAGGTFSSTVMVSEPGTTVRQSLYQDNGAKLPSARASIAKAKKHKAKKKAKKKKPVLLGTGAAVAATPGAVKVTVKLSKQGRSTVRKARSIRLVLVTTLRDAAGNVRTLPVKKFTAVKGKANAKHKRKAKAKHKRKRR